MSDYSRGGYIPGPSVPTVIEPDECLIGRDLTCVRRDDAHAAADVDMRYKPWICPLHEVSHE